VDEMTTACRFMLLYDSGEPNVSTWTTAARTHVLSVRSDGDVAPRARIFARAEAADEERYHSMSYSRDTLRTTCWAFLNLMEAGKATGTRSGATTGCLSRC
jgi:hypothetical protein